MTPPARLDAVASGLPRAYPGPGGAVAVLRGGEVLVRHAWGWANAEQRIPFTPRTMQRLCSITKQFTCATLIESFRDPSALDGDVRACLTRLDGPVPGALHLCHNQSGLRDYWAIAMLHGSPAEAPFGDREAAQVIGGARTLQFAPGTRYSYSNGNFRLLSELLSARTGRPFAELLRTLVLHPAGMESACVVADTRAMPDGTEGYEGTVATGFRPAVNRVFWTGDAGLCASLDDLIAWEKSIDRTRDDPASIYRRLSAPTAFADGTTATYGFGLSRREERGRLVTGHGGALRGWRSHRVHVPAERLSVVVLFNHMADARAAAADMMRAALGETAPNRAEKLPAPPWTGAYREPETGLAVRIEDGGPGRLRLRFGHNPELLPIHADGTASDGGVTLRQDKSGLWMDRIDERLSSRLRRRDGPSAPDIAGRYRNAELDAELEVADAGGTLYGAFAGFLGRSRMELLEPVGTDLWALPCPRALDHTPPGNWTLAVERDGTGRPAALEVGCWLARGLRYERV